MKTPIKKTSAKLQLLLNSGSVLLISYLIAIDAVHSVSVFIGMVLAIAIKLASDNVDGLWE